MNKIEIEEHGEDSNDILLNGKPICTIQRDDDPLIAVDKMLQALEKNLTFSIFEYSVFCG
jgi:hypothetical protein